MRGIYISEPMNGIYYIAVRSPRGRQKFLWSTMRVKPTAADTRIEACEVLYHIRRQAYRHLAKKMLMQTYQQRGVLEKFLQGLGCDLGHIRKHAPRRRNLAKKWRVDRVANLTAKVDGAGLVDTNDTKTMGSDIGTIQKACSVIGANSRRGESDAQYQFTRPCRRVDPCLHLGLGELDRNNGGGPHGVSRSTRSKPW
jgi:hypothetical protein